VSKKVSTALIIHRKSFMPDVFMFNQGNTFVPNDRIILQSIFTTDKLSSYRGNVTGNKLFVVLFHHFIDISHIVYFQYLEQKYRAVKLNIQRYFSSWRLNLDTKKPEKILTF